MTLSILNIVNRIRFILKNICYYRFRFKSLGWRSTIKSTLAIDHGENIELGNIHLGYKAWLAANPLTDAQVCRLIIKDGCVIGNFNHIYATGKIVLEKDVLTADRVYISDNLHGYEDISTPIKQQPIKQHGQVKIGEGSWLGENVSVIGSSIGKHCVIGANSVVTHDIPDYSVAVGIPAKVIKKYDFINKQWVKV